MDWMAIIQTLGFPIACVVACAFFIYKLVTRNQDEAKEREEKLLNVNSKSADALKQIAETIEKSNDVNSSLSETNRLLVDKMETKLVDIDENVTKILDKIEK